MTPFLRQVAGRYLAEGGISGTCFIFPNRRSMVFFRKHLSDEVKAAGAPVIAPELTTVNDFFYRVCGVSVSDRVTLLLELYACYRELNPKAEPLDEFIFWGDIILGDFNDTDKYLVNPKQLFTNVSDYKALQDTFIYLTDRQRQAVEGFVRHFNDRSGRLTVDLGSDNPDVKARFLMIWNILYPLYQSYNAVLRSKGMAYEGMVYRRIAEEMCGKGSARGNAPDAGGAVSEELPDVLARVFKGTGKFVFVGLNALNECEKTVMRLMRDRGLAEFCWDYSGEMIRDSRNRSSWFMKDNVKEFPQKYGWDPEGPGRPEIRVISVPSSTGQVKQVPHILKEIADTQAGGDMAATGSLDGAGCAIVLPDETLLLPLLNTVPPEIRDINVTMGYPVSGSGFYAMMSTISAMQLHSRGSGSGCSFYYRQVWSLFSSGILKKVMDDEDRLAAKAVKAAARLYIPVEDLRATELFRLIFRPVVHDAKLADRSQIEALATYQLDVISHIGARLAGDEEMLVELDFAKEYYRCVNRLKAIAPEVQPMTYLRILEQLLSGVSVPFRGEPLKGLQIMGPLETRALDFRNVIILSANEGVFPRRSVSSSFIPPELRRGFGLPTYEYQDAVWAYYFYRMITRAENVWMLYDSRTEGLKSGEESRYIRQLEYHFRLPVARYVPDIPVRASCTGTDIPKTQADVDEIRSSALSASSIESYMACPARFYYQSVRHLKAETEVAESLDAPMIGNVFHKAMQSLYSGEAAMMPGAWPESCIFGRKSITVTEDYLRSWKSRENDVKAKVRSLIMEELRSSEVTGRNLVIEDVIVRYVMRTIDRDLEALEDSHAGHFTILGLEERLGCRFEGFSIKGIVDRIDSFAPGKVRVVDYKTGKVLPEDMMITDDDCDMMLERLFGDVPYFQKPKIAFQLFIYDLLLENMGHAADGHLVNAVYSTARLFNDVPAEAAVGKAFMEKMKEALSGILSEIADTGVPFRRTDDLDVCARCDFRMICGR